MDSWQGFGVLSARRLGFALSMAFYATSCVRSCVCVHVCVCMCACIFTTLYTHAQRNERTKCSENDGWDDACAAWAGIAWAGGLWQALRLALRALPGPTAALMVCAVIQAHIFAI